MPDASFDTLSSERLLIRRFEAGDAGALAAYRSDPEVARYQSWESCEQVEAQRFIASLTGLEPGTPGEWFQFAVTLAPGRQLIGDCALQCLEHDPRQAELGFTFATAHQGQGFAAEAVGRVVGYAFATLGLHRIFALTDERNHPAKRLLERLGFRCEGRLEQSAWYKGEWVSEFLYARLRAEWQSSAG